MMQAMVLPKPQSKLELQDMTARKPGPFEVGVRVSACGVCRTDLHILDGELAEPVYPIIPGHEIVGDIIALGESVRSFRIGDRVGIPWLGHTCGSCPYCKAGQENLCDAPRFTGYQIPGGYADYTVAEEKYCFALPPDTDCAVTAPLLCAGLIGYRSYRMAGQGEKLGIYGFGAAAHLLIQVAVKQGRQVYAFTRPGDTKTQQYARELGAAWAGPSDQLPPAALDAAIIFAPVGELVPAALAATRKGGIVVCGGIHMSPIPSFAYALLWGERRIQSVANLTRQDAREFLKLAHELKVTSTIHRYPLSAANEALQDLRQGAFDGAAVLIP